MTRYLKVISSLDFESMKVKVSVGASSVLFSASAILTVTVASAPSVPSTLSIEVTLADSVLIVSRVV